MRVVIAPGRVKAPPFRAGKVAQSQKSQVLAVGLVARCYGNASVFAASGAARACTEACCVEGRKACERHE